MRVRFPDGYVLEADFLPSERIHSLVDLLMKVLARPDLPFYLCKFCFSLLSYFTLDHSFVFYNLIWVWFAMIRLSYICFWQANMLAIMASREKLTAINSFLLTKPVKILIHHFVQRVYFQL